MNPSILQEIFPPPYGKNIRVFVKRDDLLHPEIQGNKWRKLAPILGMMGKEKKGVLSFGGPYSNHLHALAAAGKSYGFDTVGIVRGTAADPENPTLAYARRCGMKLFPVTKSDYEWLKKSDPTTIFRTIAYQPDTPFLCLPEGGDTIEALIGCTGVAVEIMDQLPANAGRPLYFCVPAGTGCTAAGLIAAARPVAQTLVFPAAPYGVDRESILAKLSSAGFDGEFDFQIVENLKPRKFARMTPELMAFINTFHQKEGILLDPVYTSKMIFRLYEMLAQQFFPEGSCVVALHTGGLQGWH